MEQRIKKKMLQVDGMSCTSCELRIESALEKLDGVLEAEAFAASNKVYVTYDADRISLAEIVAAIEALDYPVKNKPGAAAASAGTTENPAGERLTINQLLGLGIILLAVYVMVNNTVGFNFIPEVNQYMGYGLLFVVGVLTSLHCIAMCGGINLSQCLAAKVDGRDGQLTVFRPSLLYNTGRVISYTVIGGIVGALGSVISFSGAAKGVVAILAGVFMMLMGLNMLNVFPGLRRFLPRMPKFVGRKIQSEGRHYGPFYVGLLNGFMPCGPLQAMQLYALGTGSFLAGATSMFMFSLGTVPLMFGLGAVSSLLSSRFTHKMMKASAVLVIALGLVMANRGLALSGVTAPSLPLGINSSYQSVQVATIHDGVQTVTTKLYPGRYEPIIVQKGIPVRWNIKAEPKDINGCNNEIIIPQFNQSKKLAPGDNIIEFTPTQTGTFGYSCWMGMIRSRIMVVDDLNNIDIFSLQQSQPEDYDRLPSGCSCCQVLSPEPGL